MNELKDKLPSAEDIIQNVFGATIDDLRKVNMEDLRLFNENVIKEAMHEYCKQVIDVIAEAIPEKKYNGLDTHCGGKNCPFEYSCKDGCMYPEEGVDFVPNEKILRLKGMLK